MLKSLGSSDDEPESENDVLDDDDNDAFPPPVVTEDHDDEDIQLDSMMGTEEEHQLHIPNITDSDVVRCSRSSTIELNPMSNPTNAPIDQSPNVAPPSIVQQLRKIAPQGIESVAELFNTVTSKVKRYLNRVTFTGLLMLHGSVPLSCKQYNMVLRLVNSFLRPSSDCGDCACPKCGSKFACGLTKLRKNIFPYIVQNVLPKSTVLTVSAGHKSMKPVEDWLPLNEPGEEEQPLGEDLSNFFDFDDGDDDLNHEDHDVSGSQRDDDRPSLPAVTNPTRSSQRTPNEPSNTAATTHSSQHTHNESSNTATRNSPKKDCYMVKPSQWAKTNLGDSEFLSLFKQQQQTISSLEEGSRNQDVRSFSNSPILSDPASVSDRDRQLWIQNEDKTDSVRARFGDFIQVRSHSPNENASFVESLHSAGWECSSSLSQLKGNLCAIFNAGSKRSEPQNDNKVHSIITPEKSSLSSAVQSFVALLEDQLVTPHELSQKVQQYKKCSRNLGEDVRQEAFLDYMSSILPADTCSILVKTSSSTESSQIQNPGDEQVLCVLVDRFLRSNKWPSTKFLIWIMCTVDDNGSINADVLEVTKSTGQPILVQKYMGEQSKERNDYNRDIIGTLGDGTKFYVYRFILYSDDF